MFLISLMIAFLSPLTILAVKSDSIPRIKIFKHDFYVPPSNHHKTKNLLLECEAEGYPTPRIEFHFLATDDSFGKVLDNTSRVIHRSATKIEIKNVTDADSGIYRCNAINKNGKVFKNVHVRVKVPGTFMNGENYNDPVLKLKVQLGRQQEIVCPVEKYPYPLQFYWGAKIKRGRNFVLKKNERIHIDKKGGLFFSYVKKEDVDIINKYGGISCVMNFNTEPIYSRKVVLVIEKDNISDIAPTFHVKLPGKTFVLKNERRVLTCFGGGFPVPDITWFRDGMEITKNDSQFVIKTNRPGELIIPKFTKDLEGSYKCLLSNKKGTIESDGVVLLGEEPSFERELRVRTPAFLNNRLTLVCDARGTEPLKYEWYKNGRSLTSFNYRRQAMTITKGQLIIDPVTNSTAGTFQCYAINAYGNKFSTTYVYVTEPTVDTSHIVGGKTDVPVTHFPVPKEGRIQSDTALQLKYIIIIACSGAVFVVLVFGGIFMFFRSKDSSEEIIFVPTKETRNDDPKRNGSMKIDLSRTDLKQALLHDLANLPPPPPSLTDHSDDDFSTYGGYKMDHPLYYNDNTIMYLMNHNKEEHLYADIPEDFTRCESATPSTEL